MFVYRGKVANSSNFSKFLMSFTEEHLGFGLGLRDWRQVMCTILVNIVKADFGQPDDDDLDLKTIHDQFAHSPATAASRYALQLSDALEEVSQTAVASHQRVSEKLHKIYGLCRPSKAPEVTVEEPLNQLVPLNLSEALGPLKQAIENVGSSNLASIANLSTRLDDVLQGFSSEFLRRFAYVQGGNDRPVHVPPITVHPLLAAKVGLLFPRQRFQFTSPEQAEAVQSCNYKKHVLVVMPTGSGKSLTFFGAPLLYPNKMFVVITPLVALTEDMSRRLAGTRIRGGKWHEITDPFTAQLVLVSAHQAGTNDFYCWTNSHKDRIGRIFFDEAHHIYTSNSYRKCFGLFELLTRTGIPFTFLSATIFPKSVPYLCENMRIDRSLLHEIRASTVRPNIKITRSKCEDSAHVFSQLKEEFCKISLKSDERGLIFCTTVHDCKVVSKLLRIPYYVATMHDDPVLNYKERARLEKQWRDGVEPWMVATLCFGQGVDYSHVRWVVHVEVDNLLNYVQEIGRAGRDGSIANAHIIFSTLPPLSHIKPPDHDGVMAMREYLEIWQCRRISIHSHVDGNSHSCASIPNAQLCDFCESISLVMFLYFKWI
jgi:Helicase conserved C-terminal domain/Type III restriction enzyme, res subunit